MTPSGRLQPVARSMNKRLLSEGADVQLRRYRGNILEQLVHFT